MYNKLLPRFEDLFIELIVILDAKIPASIMEDMEFFIKDRSVTAISRNNTSLSYRIGKETALAIGSYAIGVNALWCLFLARDAMLKAFSLKEVEELLNDCQSAINLFKHSQTK